MIKNIASPKAKKMPKKLEAHSDIRIDNYYWLNNREDPEVIDYLHQENNYLSAQLKHTADLQKELFEEIVSRIDPIELSVPYLVNGYFYYSKFDEGKEYPIHCRKKENSNEEEVLVDVNILGKDEKYINVTALSVSPNNRYLAFGVDNVSRRIYTIWIKDLETGQYLEEKIQNTTGMGVWAKDSKSLFYTLRDEMLRSYKTCVHTIGQMTSKDIDIYEELDDTFRSQVYKTKSGKFLVIGSFNTLSTEYRILDANDPQGTFKLFSKRRENHEYSIAHQGDKFYIITNDQALNFRLMSCPDDKTSEDNWAEVIRHDSHTLLEEIECFDTFIALSQRKDGLSQIRIIPNNNAPYVVPFDEAAFMCYFSKNENYYTQKLRIGYTSLTTPSTIMDFDIVTKEKTIKKTQNILGNFDPNNYKSERIQIESRDGTLIPISIVYNKNLYKKGFPMPTLLYAYGSYGHSIDPYFSSPRLSLLDRGFIFAIAHIRGGQEMGRQWYEEGKLLKKLNTFTDFIDCSRSLIDQEYTTSDQLFAMGGSAGGLLMGAIINMNPELYKGVISAVPFVDVVTTMMDDTIPLTTFEYDEWGNPNEKPYYEYMKSYSPYDNVKAQEYPSLLVTTGLHDSQVQYWEPAKWVAKLRDTKLDDNLLLLHTNMETGHGGASGRFEKYKEVALEYAFLITLVEDKD